MRLYNWEARLAKYVASVAREGFAWGRHDCALFGAGGVEALTGVDPAAEWRGRYDSLAGGVRLMRAAGFADHVQAAENWHPPVPRSMAMPGDLAVVTGDVGAGALGIVQGAMIYVLRMEGLGLVEFERAHRILGVR